MTPLRMQSRVVQVGYTAINDRDCIIVPRKSSFVAHRREPLFFVSTVLLPHYLIAVKLVHVESSSDKAAYMLNSEQKNLGTGSGQQIVTAVMDPGSTNALWWIRGPNDPESRGERISACTSETAAGEPILCNSIIRLTHLETMRNLHSHNVKSPLSRQQEVVSSHRICEGFHHNIRGVLDKSSLLLYYWWF